MELRVCTACHRVASTGTTCPSCRGHLTLADPDFLLGQTFGRYRLLEVLGTGGMGAVFLAEHDKLRRRAALKIVLPHGDDAAFERRFLREARLLAELRHPNIVEVYDFDVTRWGLPYYVMELLRGETLREQLERGGVTLGGSAWLLRDVAAGLASAHRRGVVHRDLKPENIFAARLDDRWIGKLLDFGIAKRSLDDGLDTRLTRTGVVMGTLQYLAPEQLAGGEVGPPADQYGLALVAAEIVTGRILRAGRSMHEILHTDVTRPLGPEVLGPGVPPSVADALRRATEPDPGRRYPEVTDFVGDLLEDSDAAPAIGSSTRPFSGDRASGHAARLRHVRRPVRLAALLVALLALGALAGWIVGPGRERRPPGPEHLLAEERSLPAPMDAVRIVGIDADRAVLATADGLVLVDVDGGGEPTRVPLDPSTVLGVGGDGEVLLRRGPRVDVRPSDSVDDEPWASGLPETDDVHLSPTGRVAAGVSSGGIEILRLVGDRYHTVARVDAKPSVDAISVGERLVAAAAGGALSVWSAADGSLVLQLPLHQARPACIAIHDLAGLVAVGGWSDHVEVVRLADQTTYRIPRAAVGADRLDLEFLPAGPTLAVADGAGVRLWRPADGVVARWAPPGAAVADILLQRGRLWALDRARRRLVALELPGVEVADTISTSIVHPWAMVADPTSGRVLLGGEDGPLYAVDPASREVTVHPLHSLGITSLVADGMRLASASDDTTVAVWRLPELVPEWRSRAHGFLVNQLFLEPGGHGLWSTSSDGTLKRWSWPDLVELETVSTSELLGRRYSLHAVWQSPDGRVMLLGTWNRALLVVHRRADRSLGGHAIPMESPGGYVFVPVPRADAVLMVGVHHPYGIYLYDLAAERLLRLPDAGQPTSAAVAIGSGGRVLAFGRGVILDYRVRRDADGVLACAVAVDQHSPLGDVGAACRVDADSVAAAAADGDVHLVDLAALTAEPLLEERLEFPAAASD